MENQPTFFDFAAEVGLTKHFGGLEDTEKLVELCHIRDLAEMVVTLFIVLWIEKKVSL